MSEEMTHTDLIVEIRTGHAEINGRLDLVDQRLSGNEKQIAENGERGKQALDEVQKLQATVNTGIGAVRLLAWIGGGCLAVWGAVVAYGRSLSG